MEPISQKMMTLNNNIQMPAIGFGTYRIRSCDAILNSLNYALEAGYRMFDTAAVYGNERHIREAFKTLLPKYGLERDDIFVTTKLSPRDGHNKEKVLNAFKKSLNELGYDSVDLYLIHFPGLSELGIQDPRNKELRSKVWETLVECYNNGMAKAIGVSNFTIRHLQELEACNYGVTPAVNQVECHPYYPQTDLRDYCKGNDIVVQAYCSLGGTSAGSDALLNDPVVTNVAKKMDVTNGQVLLAWATQQEMAIIPKSTNPQRIKENINWNFTISDEDMKSLNKLGETDKKYAWDPNNVV